MDSLLENELLERKHLPDMDCPAEKKILLKSFHEIKQNLLTGPIIVACQWNTASKKIIKKGLKIMKFKFVLQSSPTGPAEHCAGGSLPKSWSS